MTESQCNSQTPGQASNSSQTDFYQILEVTRETDLATIKQQYLKFALLNHPDKNPDNLQKFKDVCLAWKVLSDQKRKAEYDQALSSTIDELRNTEGRDLDYQQTNEYQVTDEKGELEFDLKTFNEDFTQSKSLQDQEELQQFQEKIPEKKKSLEELMEERNHDLNQVQTTQVPLMRPDNWDSSVFNQMFNDMRQKRQELVAVDVEGSLDNPLPAVGPGELGTNLSSLDQVSPYGASQGSDYSAMFPQHLPEIDQEILRKRQENNYQADPNIGHVKDNFIQELRHGGLRKQMEDRLEALREDMEKNKHLPPEEYVVEPGLLNKALGDPDLFREDPILGLEAVKKDLQQETADIVGTD